MKKQALIPSLLEPSVSVIIKASEVTTGLLFLMASLVFDKESVIQAADNAGIVIVGIEENVTGELSY